MTTLECPACEQRRRGLICAACLRKDFREHRAALASYATERDALVAAAERALDPRANIRGLRADTAALRNRVTDIQRHLGSLRELNDNNREVLAARRSALAGRREILARAQYLDPNSNRLEESRTPTPTPPGGPPRRRSSAALTSPSPIGLPGILAACKPECETLQDVLARARQGLVHELVEVFEIVEVGGRPPIGSQAGSRGEWAIAGLVLPVPGDVRRYTPVEINAVLTHTIHFIGLLTYYLGVKLPFEISWSGGKIGVGQPYICAGKGPDSGGWARWIIKNPLHLPMTQTSSNSSPPTSTPTSPSASISSPYPPLPTSPGAIRARTLSTSDSQADISADDVNQPPASFTTAFAMLIYNVAYLAYTQSVDIPLSQTGEVLRNLWAICCSPDLGRRSHETLPLLPPPTPPSFRLDFKQLLQATTADPASRTRPRSSRQTSSAVKSGATARPGRRPENIAEEDEWDLLEDAP